MLFRRAFNDLLEVRPFRQGVRDRWTDTNYLLEDLRTWGMKNVEIDVFRFCLNDL
jgi:hypothetical protein